MDIVKPITSDIIKAKPTPKGRLADLVACIVAGISASLALIVVILFFAGFAANDTNPAGLASAFVLSVGLGAFAVLPALIIAYIAYRAWRTGLSLRGASLSLLLSLPWVILAALILHYTPLPFYIGLSAFTISLLICVWTVISIGLLIKKKKN